MEGKARVKVVLLDIEGTTCPISFVKDVLFPNAIAALPETLATQWDSPSFITYRSAFPLEHASTPEALISHVHDLMARDLKISYLKSLQGYLWLRGYESGQLKCPLFSDVYPAMKKWNEEGAKVCIYSSGSVEAQKLLWRYTTDGDLRGLIWNGVDVDGAAEIEGGYWDTVNAGLKQERASYDKIAKANRGLGEVGEWLFLSDNINEVRAAKEAGMKSFVVVRDGNAKISAEEREGQVLVESFEEVEDFVEIAGERVVKEAEMESFVVVQDGNAKISAEKREEQVLVESFGKAEGFVEVADERAAKEAEMKSFVVV